MGGARLPLFPTVVALEEEMVLVNFGDAAASEKLDTMGDGCADPGRDF